MADGHGGARTPANPAVVSGPGALSQRTDGQPARYVSGLPYGQGQELMGVQQSAPMSAVPANPNAQHGSAAAVVSGDAAPPPALFAPTERPDEPLTEGNQLGAGAGPNVLSHGAFRADAQAEVPGLKARYMPALLHAADQPNVPASFKRFVRVLRDMQ